ncbi:MAG: hypothetical protein FWF35_02540 [Elusimicrobia bacterium]|nr:hypothetical protein [Elusimicrobiota bacterium]
MNIIKTAAFKTLIFAGLFILCGINLRAQNEVSTWDEFSSAISGGATAVNVLDNLIATSNTPVQSSGTTFTLNGGGFTLDGVNAWQGLYNNEVTVTVNDITMQNFVNGIGGAIRLYDQSYAQTLNVGDNSSFINNSSNGQGDGGAIFNGNAPDGDDVINIGNNVTFSGNTAAGQYGSGGAIYGDIVNIGSNAVFTNNHAVGSNGGYGGAISASGTLSIGAGAVFTDNNAATQGGAISFGTGTMTLNTNGGTTIFDGNTDGSGPNDISLFSYDDGTTILDTYLNIEGNSGTVIFNGGIATSYSSNTYINKDGPDTVVFGANANNDNFTGTYTQTAGTTTYYGGVLAGTNNIENSTLNLLQGAPAVSINNLNLDTADVNSMDGVINNFTVTTFSAANKNNFYVDIDGAAGTSDTFDFVSPSGTGTINIGSFNILTAPTAPSIPLQIFTDNGAADFSGTGYTFTSSKSTVMTPLYLYNVISDGNGLYTLLRTPALNKNAFRGSVATMSAYYNQLAINEYVFEQDYFRNEKIWVKVYGSGDELKTSEDLTARGLMYGVVAGAYLTGADLGNGWDFKLGAYAAYNGSNIKFEQTRIIMNGGQFGLGGAFKKDNFGSTVLLYAGGYDNAMSLYGHTDNAPNWFTGVALKSTYDIDAAERLIIRPGLTLAYNMYGSQNWNSGYGSGMGMSSSALNGFYAAPGVDFVYGFNGGWSGALTAKYFYGFNDNVSGVAGPTVLPSIHTNSGYVECGLGAEKEFTDMISSYAQVVARGGSVSGVGVNAGVAWRF